jgi:hypothetical protein
MSGIKHLSEIYKKQGSEFLDSLFSREVTASEKLNGMSFSFERGFMDGTIYFYKRDQDNPISKIDRILMPYYDDPIQHIKNTPESVIDEIPAGWRFGMEYFMNSNPVCISYQKIPKNGLVLTHITVKNQFGDIEKTIVDKEELEYWADLLDVDNPPIIFQGKLSDEQKNKINDFVNSPNDILKKDYGTESFAKYLINILNPDLDKTFLNDSLNEPIEGVVFRFGDLDGTGESFTAKILDPIFDDLTKQNNIKRSSYLPSDIYGITILDTMNHILDKGVDSFFYVGEDPNDKYISYICSVFNSFIKENGEKYLGLDFQEPDYLKNEVYPINFDLIKDEETKKLIEEDESYKSLFKLILSAFRKIKKREGGFFTKGVIEQFNILIKEVGEYLNKQSFITESSLPTFDQFRSVKTKFIIIEEDLDDNVVIKKEDEDLLKPVIIEDPNEEIKPERNEIINKLSTVLNFKGEESLIDKSPVNVVIGKFSPFNNGHYKLIKKANQQNGYPVCVFVNGGRSGKISRDTMEKMMDLIKSDFGGIINSVKFIEDDLLSSAIENLEDEFYPETITVGKNKLNNYILQSKSLKKKNKIHPQFSVQTAPEWISSKNVIDSIRGGDYLEFKKNTPKPVHGLWEDIKKCFSEDI